MPRRRNLFVPFVAEAFAQGTLQWGSPVTEVKFIKEGMAAQLAAAGVTTVIDIVLLATEAHTLHEVADLFAELVRSPRINECVGEGDAAYLPRAFNRMAFNSLADILDFAVETRNVNFGDHAAVRNRLRDFHLQHHAALGDHSTRRFLVDIVNEHERGNIGRHVQVRAGRRCPCRTTAAACNADAECQWVPAGHHNPNPGCVVRAFLAEGADPEQTRRRTGPLDWHAPDDADLAAQMTAAGIVKVSVGDRGNFRVPRRRGGRQRRQTGVA